MAAHQHHELERWSTVDSELPGVQFGPGRRRMLSESSLWFVLQGVKGIPMEFLAWYTPVPDISYQRRDGRLFCSPGCRDTWQFRGQLVPRAAPVHFESLGRKDFRMTERSMRSSAWMRANIFNHPVMGFNANQGITVSTAVAMPGGLPTSKPIRQCGCLPLDCGHFLSSLTGSYPKG